MVACTPSGPISSCVVDLRLRFGNSHVKVKPSAECYLPQPCNFYNMIICVAESLSGASQSSKLCGWSIQILGKSIRAEPTRERPDCADGEDFKHDQTRERAQLEADLALFHPAEDVVASFDI